MLEKLWVENENIPLQLVNNIMNKTIKTRELVSPTENGNHDKRLAKIIPKKLLDHLLNLRTRALIKIENEQ